MPAGGGTLSAEAGTGASGYPGCSESVDVRALFESYKSLTIFIVSVATVVTFLISSRM